MGFYCKETTLLENQAVFAETKINEELQNLKSDDGGINMGHLWKLKKKLCGTVKEPSVAKMDSKGHLVTSNEKLKDLYLQTYINRLENNEIKSDLKYFEKFKEK